MDLNYIFFVLVVLSTLPIAVRRGGVAGARFVALVVLLGALGCFVALPAHGGYVAAGLWLAGIVVPGVADARLVARWVVGDLQRVAELAPVLAWLHPVGEVRRRAEVLGRLAVAARRPGSAGDAALAALGPLAERWEIERGALRGDWRGVVVGAGARLGHGGLDELGGLRYLRALGEVGAVTELDRFFTELHGAGLREPAQSMARLVVAAFHGERELVAALIEGPLRAMPAEGGRFWRATAAAVAGNVVAAEREFEVLSRSDAADTARAAAQRLATPLEPGAPLSYDLRAHMGGVLADEARYGEFADSPGWLIRALMIACGLTFFYAEVSGGSTDGMTLYRLGAFLPSAAVLEGEWWRFLTALFLHAGLAHVAFNLLALYNLAPFVERTLGPLRCVGVYFISGVGGLGVITVATLYLGFDEHLVLGASGGVMGLVGATAAILRRAAELEGSRVAAERLRSIGTIIAIQVVFDLVVPQTSATAHLAGVGIGYLMAQVFQSGLRRG